MNDIPNLKGEDKLNVLFASLILSSIEFRSWLLGKTKFSQLASSSEPIFEAEYLERQRNFWWKDWWSYVPLGSNEKASGQIDIFVVFQYVFGSTNRRFALLIENKLAHSTFTKYQLLGSYRQVGTRRLNDKDWLNYTDFETMLMSPRHFYNKYQEQSKTLFDRIILHEEIAQFLPDFAHS